MKTIKAYYTIINKERINGKQILKDIERVGRTCYKSEKMMTEDSAAKFVNMLIDRGHEAMIEHNAISVKFICDRGVSHELVRHRVASFAQESTRYCNYSKDKFGNELTFIEPCFFGKDDKKMLMWLDAMYATEKCYFRLLELGAAAQEARSVLPNSLKTEMDMTMNLREWRHFFNLRCDAAAHPQMRELTIPLLKEMSYLIPVVFDDLKEKFIKEDVVMVDIKKLRIKKGLTIKELAKLSGVSISSICKYENNFITMLRPSKTIIEKILKVLDTDVPIIDKDISKIDVKVKKRLKKKPCLNQACLLNKKKKCASPIVCNGMAPCYGENRVSEPQPEFKNEDFKFGKGLLEYE